MIFPTIIFLITLTACYLVGSIPTAYIFGLLFKGIDIRGAGSGNVGATNVYRVVGKVPGLLALALDIFKGFVCVTFVPYTFFGAQSLGFESSLYYRERLLLGLAAIVGHNWPIFLRFRGGKGIATSAGVLLGLIPWVLFASFTVWLVIFILTRYVSLASISASVALPIIVLIVNMPLEFVIFGAALCVLSTYKHRPNIRRLLLGQERRIF